MKNLLITGSFDNLQSRHVRFLEEASRLGAVHVNLWSDETIQLLTGAPPKFTGAERAYFVQAIRTVRLAHLLNGISDPDQPALPAEYPIDGWVVSQREANEQKRAYCAAKEISYQVIGAAELGQIPPAPRMKPARDSKKKKVVVTGCFDWLHSGHVRFFEETASLGDLYVVLGHDQNVRLLKGAGHPMFSENKRRYMVQAIRYVKEALVSSGSGWLDAEPEIALINPDIYAVNEDGDKAEKRAFCAAHGIEYVVLQRLPKEGLPKRESTTLRGF